MRRVASLVLPTGLLASALLACGGGYPFSDACSTYEVEECPSFEVGHWCQVAAPPSGVCTLENATFLCPVPSTCDIDGFELAANPASLQRLTIQVAPLAGLYVLEIEVIGASVVEPGTLSVRFDGATANCSQDGQGNHFLLKCAVLSDATVLEISREPSPDPLPQVKLLVTAQEPCRTTEQEVCGV